MGRALLRVQLALVWNSFAGGSRKKGTKTGIAAAMVITAAALAMMFSFTFDAMAAPYYDMGIGWFYFTFFLLVDFCLMLLGSVFTAKAQLFEAKDNAQLLAMPIPPGQILFSRMASLILVNGFFQLTVAVPAAVCWLLHCPVTVTGAVAFLLFFGTLVVQDYSLGKNVVTTVGTVLCMAVIMFIVILFASLVSNMIGFVSGIVTEINYRS